MKNKVSLRLQVVLQKKKFDWKTKKWIDSVVFLNDNDKKIFEDFCSKNYGEGTLELKLGWDKEKGKFY